MDSDGWVGLGRSAAVFLGQLFVVNGCHLVSVSALGTFCKFLSYLKVENNLKRGQT